MIGRVLARVAAGGLPPLVAGLVALALARWAMLPSIWFWDTAEAQTVPPLLGVMHPTGFPAYVLLGWLASVVLQPFGETAFRLNLLSGVLVGVAAAALVAIVRRLRVDAPVAVAAGIGFAATPVAWRIGTSADVHALHVALLALLLLVLVAWERAVRSAHARDLDDRAHRAMTARADRLLVIAAGITGVSLANHQLTLLFAPAIGVTVLAVDRAVFRRWRTVLGALIACLGLAMLLYLELPLRTGPFPAPLVYGKPDTWEGLRYVVLAEQFRGSFRNPLEEPGLAATLAGRAWEELGILALLVPAAFIVTAVRQPAYALLTGTASGATLLFNSSYVNADIGRYDLGPVLMAWTWLAVLAAAAADAARGLVLPGAWRAWSVVPLAVAVLLVSPVALDVPRRHALVDRSADRTAPAWLDRVLGVLEPDALVVSWWSYSTPLWYGQLIEGRRPDVAVVDDRTRLDDGLGDVTDVIDANLGRRPVYVIRAYPREIAALADAYRLELVAQTDVVYRVLGERAG